MLEYTSLFSDLEEVFRGAGRDPASFRRLEREVRRAREDLQEYYDEVASDYVARLERRLAEPSATLTREEAALIRGYLGIPPRDAERDQRLLDDIRRLEETVEDLLRLKGAPLNLRNLDVLRRLLDRMESLLPGVIDALEERERALRFEEALGDRGPGMDRAWLLTELRRSLGSDEGVADSEESASDF